MFDLAAVARSGEAGVTAEVPREAATQDRGYLHPPTRGADIRDDGVVTAVAPDAETRRVGQQGPEAARIGWLALAGSGETAEPATPAESAVAATPREAHGMRMRTLGGTGIKVSPYCLGAMMFGAWGNTDHEDSIRIIHAALDGGINFVDTADVYSAGESEEIVRSEERRVG